MSYLVVAEDHLLAHLIQVLCYLNHYAVIAGADFFTLDCSVHFDTSNLFALFWILMLALSLILMARALG